MRIVWLAAPALLLMLASPSFAQVSIDVHIGQPPPPPRVYHVAPQPGPNYIWVEGYWYPQGHRYVWHNGYWTRPPYAGAYWVQPYYQSGRYYAGRWEGEHGHIYHDHRWDHEARRDEHRESHRENARR